MTSQQRAGLTQSSYGLQFYLRQYLGFVVVVIGVLTLCIQYRDELYGFRGDSLPYFSLGVVLAGVILHECRPRKEPPAYTVKSKAFNLQEYRKPITGLAVVNDSVLDDDDDGSIAESQKRCILMATSNALFCFIGAGDLGTILDQYDSAAAVCRALVIELAAEANTSASMLVLREGIADRDVDTQQLAWLTQSTLMIADLDVRPGIIDGGWDLIVKKNSLQQLPMEHFIEGGTAQGLATAQWSVLLLVTALPGGALPYIAIINRITCKQVHKLVVPSSLQVPSGLYFDSVAEEIFICGTKGYMSITEHSEQLAVWQDFLALKRFDEALSQAEGDSTATAQVLLQWGQSLMAEEQFIAAAEKLGAITADMLLLEGMPTFTELVLMFYPDPACSHLDAAKAEGLERYLELKLLPYRYKEQPDANASAVAIWMLELLCDRLTNAVMENSHSDSDTNTATVEQLERRLAAFITQYSSQLEYNVLINNLDSFGRLKEMKIAASHAGRWHELLGYHLSLDEVKEALELLEKLDGNELEGAVSELMRLDSKATSHALCTFAGLQDVEPLCMLRAIAQFETVSTTPAVRDDMIELLEHLIFVRKCSQRDIHNCYVSFLAMHEDPDRLLRFMETKEAQDPSNPNAYTFDPTYALNVTKEHGKWQACIQLMMGLNMLEDAVLLSSTYADRLRIINEVHDRAMQQKLWRKVVEMEVEGARKRKLGDRETILAITRCVNDSRETLRIEDVLHLFPKDATIDDYKEPLLEHMEAASRRVEQMKVDTASATQMSSALQAQLQELQEVKGSISLDDTCSSCNVKLGSRPACDLPYQGAIQPYIVYPSGGKYHTVCAVYRLMQSSEDDGRRRRLRRLLEDLNSAHKDATHVTTPSGAVESVTKLQGELHRELQDGDPMNSEAVVKLIEQLYGGNSAAMASWDVPLTVR